MPLLERPKQLAKRTGLSERQIGHLIETWQLKRVRLGCRDFIPAGEFEKFVVEGTQKSWEDGTKDHAFAISKSDETHYITWTQCGRSRERSAGTANRDEAQIDLRRMVSRAGRRGRPLDPSEILVTDVLNDYATEREPKVTAPRVIGCAVDALTLFWQGRVVADVTPQTCRLYVETRERSANTVRRELNVLRTALSYAHKNGRLTRRVAVELPEAPEPRDRWLQRGEAARLLRAALRSPKVKLYLPLFILLALYTGRRKQAILSLM